MNARAVEDSLSSHKIEGNLMSGKRSQLPRPDMALKWQFENNDNFADIVNWGLFGAISL